MKHLGGAPDMDVFNRAIPRIKALGWHVVLHLDAPDIAELSPMIRALPLPFVIDHVRNSLDADDYRTRALLRFASEEAKHIHLFKRFREEFEDGFEIGCDVIGPAQDIARTVLSHSPLGIGLTILHFEWMTQRHYLESVRTDSSPVSHCTCGITAISGTNCVPLKDECRTTTWKGSTMFS